MIFWPLFQNKSNLSIEATVLHNRERPAPFLALALFILLNPLHNLFRAPLGLLHSLGKVNSAVQTELLARHDHAPHPSVGLTPAGHYRRYPGTPGADGSGAAQ